MMVRIRDRIGVHIAATDPEALMLMKTWLPFGAQIREIFRKSFAQCFAKPEK